MRIVHIDETFHPAFGYQCNPLAKFQQKQGNEVHIVTVESKHMYPVYLEFGDDGARLPEQDRAYEGNTDVKIHRIPARGYFARRLVYDYGALFKEIDSINPDVMLVHCLETLTAVRIMYHYSDKFPMVFDSHMLTMASVNKFAMVYEWCFKRFITPKIISHGFRVIKTQDDDYVTEKLGVPKGQTRFISFGTDTDLFRPRKESRELFCNKWGVSSDSFIVVSTGKMSKPKGGLFFARSIRKKIEASRDVVFVVVANFEGEYESLVKEELGRSENRVIFFPVQEYIDLPFFYQIADASIFPKQCSMSFYDAQACSSPVISEDNGVNLQRNSFGNGICFAEGDADSLRGSIVFLANQDAGESEKMKQAARDFIMNGYSYEEIAAAYTSELEDAIDLFKSNVLNNA